jgi:hypothetical protein
MPRFFISFRNDNTIASDDLGIDLPSLEDPRQAALSSARELVADNVRADSKTPVEEVIITDESGRELMTLSAKDVFARAAEKIAR